MVPGLRSRTSWILCLIGIVALGILSRVVHTGIAVFDKHLGDALYAAMVYAILRLFWRAAPVAVRPVRNGRHDRHRVVSTDHDPGPHAGEPPFNYPDLRTAVGYGV